MTIMKMAKKVNYKVYRCLIIILSVALIQSHQNLFSQDDRFTPDKDDAVITTQVFPTEMVAGSLYSVILRFKNTGTSIWTPEYYKAKLISSGNSYESIWNVTEVNIDENVHPGQIAAFNFHVKAPETPGEYEFKWRMFANGLFFGEATDSDYVTVSSAGISEDDKDIYQSNPTTGAMNSSAFLSHIITNEMTPKMNYLVTVTMQNTGQAPWTKADGYYLSFVDTLLNTGKDNLPYYKVELPKDVMPGEEVTFMFNVTAPDAPRNYNFAWIMKQGEQPFGVPTETFNVNVRKGTQQFEDEELQK